MKDGKTASGSPSTENLKPITKVRTLYYTRRYDRKYLRRIINYVAQNWHGISERRMTPDGLKLVMSGDKTKYLYDDAKTILIFKQISSDKLSLEVREGRGRTLLTFAGLQYTDGLLEYQGYPKGGRLRWRKF